MGVRIINRQRIVMNPGRSAGAEYGTWTEARYGSGSVDYERAKQAREATRKKGAKVTALEKGYSGWGFKYAYPLDPPQYSLFNRAGRREKDEYQLEHERYPNPTVHYERGFKKGQYEGMYSTPRPRTLDRFAKEYTETRKAQDTWYSVIGDDRAKQTQYAFDEYRQGLADGVADALARGGGTAGRDIDSPVMRTGRLMNEGKTLSQVFLEEERHNPAKTFKSAQEAMSVDDMGFYCPLYVFSNKWAEYSYVTGYDATDVVYADCHAETVKYKGRSYRVAVRPYESGVNKVRCIFV